MSAIGDRKESVLQRSEWPKVTIAIPTLNRVMYLRMALESSLSQTYPNLEVIVSNNASVDDTAAYLNACTDPRLHVLHQQERVPMTENWNACVSAATGEFFLLLSDDDLLEPTAIAAMVSAYQKSEEANRGAGIVYCGGRLIDAEGHLRRVFAHSPTHESARDLVLAFFSGERDLWLCAILFRTADIASGFSLDYSWAPDSAAWIRAVFKGHGAVFVPQELAHYRVHDNATASLSMKVWQSELQRLGQLAIDCSQAAADPAPSFPQQVKDTIAKLIIRSIPTRINAAFGKKKSEALSQYCAYLPTMMNVYGARYLAVGVAKLLLPDSTKEWLKSTLKGKPSLKG